MRTTEHAGGLSADNLRDVADALFVVVHLIIIIFIRISLASARLHGTAVHLQCISVVFVDPVLLALLALLALRALFASVVTSSSQKSLWSRRRVDRRPACSAGGITTADSSLPGKNRASQTSHRRDLVRVLRMAAASSESGALALREMGWKEGSSRWLDYTRC